MFIYRLLLQYFRVHILRFALFAALLAACGAAAGLIGARLLAGGGVEAFHLVVVDLDDSMESRLFLGNLGANERYAGLLAFTVTTADEGAALLKDGATAMFVIPKNYARDVRGGVNPPFTVTLNAAQPFKAALVRYYASAFTDMLAAAQAGVYTALDYADEQGDAKLYDKTFRDVNLKFLTLVLKRGSLYETVELPAVAAASVFEQYYFSACVFILSAAAVLFADILRKAVAGRMPRLRLAGVWPVRAAVWSVLAVFTALLPLGAAAGWAAAMLGVSVDARMAACGAGVLLCVSAWITAAAFAFPTAFSACVGVVGLQSAALFVSGGVIPTAFLPDAVAAAGRFTPNYWAVNLLTGQGGGMGLAVCGGWLLLITILCVTMHGRMAK